MRYQIYVASDRSRTLLAESDDLKSDEDKLKWYKKATFAQNLPEGCEFKMVPENHTWFNGPKVEPTQSKELDQADVIANAKKDRWMKERLARIKHREEVAEAYKKLGINPRRKRKTIPLKPAAQPKGFEAKV